MSQDVPADAGYLCGNAAVLQETIQEIFCTHSLYLEVL